MEAIGPLLILVSIPLICRWIPPNRFYGFRIPATRTSPSVWYDANALTARHLFILGVVLVCRRKAEDRQRAVTLDAEDVTIEARLDDVAARVAIGPQQLAIGLRLEAT